MPAEPGSRDDLRALLLDYLDYYRGVVAAKVTGVPDDALSTSLVPSGWTAAGLVNHLVHMERRWFRWGFLGERVDGPWGDSHPAGPGWVEADEPVAALVDRLHEEGRRTRATVEAHGLDERAAVGGRFTTPDEAPLLQWILLHVLQEYARHAGHLDVVRELQDGATGEEG